MRRTGEVPLLILTCLIVLSPLMWIGGVPLERVAAADGFWFFIWLAASALGRRNER